MGLRKLKKISLLFGLITLAALVICCDTGDKNSNRSSTPQGEHADYYKKLPSRKEFMAIQGAPLSDKFNDVYSVKVVFDLRRATIYYVNSLKYRFHYEFCQQALGNSQSLLVYNLYNYGSSGKRDYILANLNYYVSSNIYALEFASSDIIDENLVSIIFNEVERTSYVKDSLKVLISSGTLVKLDNENKLKLPKVYVSDIYKNQKYQILNAGTSYGILRKIDDIEKDYLKVTPHDIIVIKGTPVNVPVCAGIITDIYQTPLSHINVLCHNRNIPSAVMIDAWNSDKMDKFSGKPVMITVNNDSMHIELSTKEAVDIFWKKRVPKNKVVLRANLSVKHLLPLKDFNTRTKDVVGNKAAGLGELAKIAKKENGIFSVPEGAFAVPFYFYHEHVSDPKIQKEIYELLTNPLYTEDLPAAKMQLKKIRQAIKDKPLDETLLNDIKQTILINNFGKSYRFRSSSNAEDMAGFSGAGLYTSKTGILGDTTRSIEKAIKSVWASTWDEKAYLERAAFNIDQKSIEMGLLCHRNFPEEIANGVAITKNIYRDGFIGFTINVQKGEVSVVSPPDSVTCEQFTCMKGSDFSIMNHDKIVDYITYSNINHNKPVLTQPQIEQLYNALEKVKGYYYYNVVDDSRPEFADYGLDIEFKFDKNGKLYLKQCRPYR